VLSLCIASTAGGQRSAVVASQSNVADADVRELLARRITLDVTNIPLQVVLKAVASQGKVLISYREALLDDAGHVVTLKVTQQPLGKVLEQLLAGTDLQFVVTGRGLIALKPMPAGTEALMGIVTGVVTNAKTKQPIVGVSVALDDSVIVVRTQESGRYRLTNVRAGSHKITVRFIGFTHQTRLVNVMDDQTATADFALESSTATLDQVVVTATGAQRYRELGHVVTQINADSVVREAPITSVSELLTARVPGLQVLPSSGGVVGGDVALRIRGTSTTALDPQPIVIVDGVRYKSTNFTGSGEDARPFNAPPRSPLNDLNVNDIDKIEVVKGPSASTLYGPDAANGVIVITTKRGQTDQPQWHVYAYPDLSTLSSHSLNRDHSLGVLQGWGHSPGTSTPLSTQCILLLQSAGLCVLDSIVSVPIATRDEQTSVIARQRPQWHSGASVSGRTAGLAYFFSGNYDAETGALRIAPAAEAILKAQLGVKALNNAITKPNTQRTLNLHTNVSSQVSPHSNISVAANYTHAEQHAINLGVFLSQNTYGGPPPGSDSAAIQSFLRDRLAYNSFLQTTQMSAGRLTATVSGTVQPYPWMSANASIGTDEDHTMDQAIQPRDALGQGDNGAAYDNQRSNTNRNAHAGMTLTHHANIWSFRSSFGGDYEYVNLDGLNTYGSALAPGSQDITTASSQSVSRLWNETASLGGYGEEIIGVRDRLFLTASLRLDGSTSFGDAYTPRPFPKFGVSWVISEEPFFSMLRTVGLGEVRLRYAFGAASRYPTSEMKLGHIGPENTLVEDRTQTVFLRQTLPNPMLQPERSKEAEYGFDARAWSVIQLGATWYRRRTDEQLQLLGAPFGELGGWANVGDLSAHGFEATFNIKAIETNRVALDLAVTYANNENKVLSLGSASETKSVFGSVVVGYPINAAFGTTTIGYADTASLGTLIHPNDGYIVFSREVVSSPVHYLGVLNAPSTYTVTPSLSLLGGLIRVSTLFDGQRGGVLHNTIGFYCAGNKTCPSAFLKSTPLLQQAKNLAVNQGDEIMSSNFDRWRQFSISGDLPLQARRALHLSRAAASFQVSNLAFWAPALVPDPESIPGFGATATGGAYAGAYGIPLPRTWTLRFDIVP